MSVREASYRILYRDIDSMGYLYYGRYLALFELGRVEWMREEGVRYRDMEAAHGILLPVTVAQCRYLWPLRYDDLAVIQTWIDAWSGTTLRFAHKVLSQENGRLCATGEIELGCMAHDSRRPVRLPPHLVEALERAAPHARGRRRPRQAPAAPEAGA